MTSAILLIAHGSRRKEANDELVTIAEQLSPFVAPAIVEVAYLEVVGPTIPEGLEKCVSHGATSIRILPYFLSPGAHVVDDLEQARQDFLKLHPNISCQLCPPLGRHPKLLEILVDHSKEEF